MKPEASASRYDDPINYAKPMFLQVGQLGDKYNRWIHEYTSVKEFRMFESDFMESFSKTSWYVVPIFWLPVVAWLSLLSLFCHEQSDLSGNFICSFTPLSKGYLSSSGLGLTFTLGVLSWTLLEYSLHRGFFHLILANTPFWITFHFLMHGQHHKFPLDKGRLVFPPLPALILARMVYALCLAVAPLHIARGLMAGIIFGYIAYDLTHYYIHHSSPSIFYFMSLKQAHMRHHYRDSEKGYGISCKLWDYFFGTLSR